MSGPVLCSYSKMLLQEHFDVYTVDGLHIGDEVVLNTRRGVEFGRVVAEPGATRMRRNEATAGNVLRRASVEDRAKHSAERVRVKKRPELREAQTIADDAGLKMLFVELEETLDDRKLIFYFIAPKRVDFRDMVKDMAEAFSKKIELRQVGDRDVARLSGDVGSCGQELCCKTFILDFVPVSMRMAKNQGLGLDNSKISGMCGRLKCCLKYEDELYTQLRKTMPISGQPAIRKADKVEGWVAGLNVLNQTVVLNIQGSREEHSVEDIEFDPDMSERAVRRWQKEMREEQRIAYEERIREREDRAKAKRERVIKQQAIVPDAATSKGEGSEGDSSGQPRKKRSNRRRKPQGERKDGAPKQASEGGGESGDAVRTDGDGQPRKKKRRRRSRGGRGRNKPKGEGGDSDGGGNSGGGAPGPSGGGEG